MKSLRNPLTALTAVVALAALAMVGRTATSGALFTSRTVNGGGAVSAAPDWTPPTVSLAHPGAIVRGTVSLTATASDAISGVAGVTIAGAPAGASTWVTVCTRATAPWSCSLDTTTRPDGVYDLRATAVDRAGYSAAAVVTGVRIDNTAPAGILTVAASPLSGSVPVAATVTDTGSGLGTVALQWTPSGTTNWSTVACTRTGTGGSCTLDTTKLADGAYDLRVQATDLAGNVGHTPVVTRQVLNRTSVVTMQAPSNYLRGTVSLAATASSNVGVTSVRIQRSTAAAGPWTDVCTPASAPYTCSVATSGFPNGNTYFRAVMVDGAGFTNTSVVVGPTTVDNSLVHGVDIQAQGTGNRLFGNGDVFLYTYSQVIQPGSLLAGWNGSSRSVAVRVTDSTSGTRPTDFMTVFSDLDWDTRINVGDVEMGTSVMGPLPQNMNFEGSMVMETVTFEGRPVTQVRVTVGPWRAFTGTALLNSGTSQMIWRPSNLTRDTWSIVTATTATYETGPLDNDL